MKSNTRKGWEKLPDGRKNKPEYAERAVLEGLVNHFIHRDYTVMGGEVHLDIYDDRIAITSPGGMYNGRKVQELDIDDISSDRRNPILADVMAQLDYMEKRGSGLRRICEETGKLESYREERKPAFKSDAHHFTTIIYSMEYEAAEAKVERGSDQIVTKQSLSSHQATDYVTDYVADYVTDQVRRLLFVMVGEMSTTEMMKELGLKHTPSFRETYLMPSLNAGILQMTQPDKPKSPKQRYFLTDLGKRLLENEQSRVVSVRAGGNKVEEFISSLTEEERKAAFEMLKSGK